MLNDKSLSNLLYFSNFSSVIDRTHQIHLKTPCCDSWDIQGQSLSRGFKALSCTQNPFAWSWCLHLLGNFLVACICAWCHIWEFYCTPITQLVIEILKEYCAWFCQAIWSNMFLLLLTCIVNLFSKSASQEEACCIIVRDQFLSWGSSAALHCFLTQKSVSKMGRGRKRHRTSKKSTDENDHSLKRTRWRDCYSSSSMHKSQKRKNRRFYRNEFKQPSPNRRTRNWEW